MVREEGTRAPSYLFKKKKHGRGEARTEKNAKMKKNGREKGQGEEGTRKIRATESAVGSGVAPTLLLVEALAAAAAAMA